MRTDFYIYEHWRPDTNVCFYVGKGYGSRARCMAGRNWRHARVQAILVAAGLKVEVRFAIKGLTGEEAIVQEIERIAFYGRRNLVNMTDGGEGPLGRKATARQKAIVSAALTGVPKSAEVRAKISASLTGRKFGKRHSDVGPKIGAALRGRKKSATHVANLTVARNTPEYKQRMSESSKVAQARRSPENLKRSRVGFKITCLLRKLRATRGEPNGIRQ